VCGPPPRADTASAEHTLADPAEVTVDTWLIEARRGDPHAVRRVFDIVYDQLRVLARMQRRRSSRPETLNTTALVHEAFVKLVRNGSLQANDRAHFMALAATSMRQILVSYARRQCAAKRGGGRIPLSFAELEHTVVSGSAAGEAGSEGLIALDGALIRLGQHSERQQRVVVCRFFGSMSIEETAVALGVSPATVKRDWSMAQAWLYREMQEALQ
jgi:RNA polymerase sigma factor (TIGR02999 family)